MTLLASILLLLQLASQLLVTAQKNPNLTPAQVKSATDFANYAISFSLEALKNQANRTTTTTEIPPVLPLPVIQLPVILGAMEVVKEVKFDINRLTNQNGSYYNIRAYYSEDGKNVPGVLLTVTADDAGSFNADGNGGQNSMLTRLKVANDGSAGANFQYIPVLQGDRTLTFTANGISVTTTVSGQM